MSTPEPTAVQVEEVKPVDATVAVEPTPETKAEEPAAAVVSLTIFLVKNKPLSTELHRLK